MSENTTIVHDTTTNTPITEIAPPLPGAVVDDWRRMEWVAPVYKRVR
jgi:hypothetical protein